MPGRGWLDIEGTTRSRQRREHFENKKFDCALHADNERKRILFPLGSIQTARLTGYISKQTWGFSTRVFDDFLLKLFEKYAELLKRRFSDDFQEVRGVSRIMNKTFRY